MPRQTPNNERVRSNVHRSFIWKLTEVVAVKSREEVREVKSEVAEQAKREPNSNIVSVSKTTKCVHTCKCPTDEYDRGALSVHLT